MAEQLKIGLCIEIKRLMGLDQYQNTDKSALAMFGKGLVQPICHDEIAIKTQSGLVKLIPKGVNLPYPADGEFAQNFDVAVPETTMNQPCDLKVQIIGGNDERQLFSGIWKITSLAHRDTPIGIEYRYDENQILELRMRLKDSENENDFFQQTIENQFTNVINPNSKRVLIDELEEKLRTMQVAHAEIPSNLSKLAVLYALGQREKAIDYFKKAIQAKGKPDDNLLNKLAIYYGQLGNVEKEEKCYREAIQVQNSHLNKFVRLNWEYANIVLYRYSSFKSHGHSGCKPIKKFDCPY